MENLKIRVTPVESEEAQKLLFELGYKWRGLQNPKAIYMLTLDEFYIIAYIKTWDMQISGFFENSSSLMDFREITLPQLRDMVVLHRNDVNDATHENSMYKYFKACDDWYYFDLGCTDKWQKSTGAKPEYYEKLKPIEKTMKEFLNTKTFMVRQSDENGNIAFGSDYADWIEIPEGAEKATQCGKYLIFWKNNIESFSRLDGDTDWTSGGDNMPFDEYFIVQSDVSIVWDRKKPDAAVSLNNIVKTAEAHREHNLSNELNDLCAEFGCLPGVDRMAWLRGQLRIAKTVRILGAELTSQCNW